MKVEYHFTIKPAGEPWPKYHYRVSARKIVNAQSVPRKGDWIHAHEDFGGDRIKDVYWTVGDDTAFVESEMTLQRDEFKSVLEKMRDNGYEVNADKEVTQLIEEWAEDSK